MTSIYVETTDSHQSAVLYTAPAVEPLSLNEAKAQIRKELTETDEDDSINAWIVAARQACEQFTRRSLITQVWELFLDEFPDTTKGIIKLPWPNLRAVTHIKYYDTDGVQQTLSTSLYQTDIKSVPGRVSPAYNESWPDTRELLNAVEIRYSAGYGDAASAVPGPIKQAMKLLIAHFDKNREAVNVGNIVTELPFAVRALLSPYRDFRF